MKDSAIYYSVGPLLYCPANNPTVAASIMSRRFGDRFSLALCLEDTIADAHVAEAEAILARTLSRLYRHAAEHGPRLPKIFIRVREPQQIGRLTLLLKESLSVVTGFIFPSFSPDNADDYIHAVLAANEHRQEPLYMMPIYESRCLVDLRSRYEILYLLKERLRQAEELVLNIRVGGNDLCNIFGFRRPACASIHKIGPVASILSDIVTVYGTDYVVSGPVWEYYSGPDWRQGLAAETADDKLCGFIGKTVIHPDQIPVVNAAYRVSSADLADARSILDWDRSAHSLVAADPKGERMDEYKTHCSWAVKTLFLAQAFGID